MNLSKEVGKAVLAGKTAFAADTCFQGRFEERVWSTTTVRQMVDGSANQAKKVVASCDKDRVGASSL